MVIVHLTLVLIQTQMLTLQVVKLLGEVGLVEVVVNNVDAPGVEHCAEVQVELGASQDHVDHGEVELVIEVRPGVMRVRQGRQLLVMAPRVEHREAEGVVLVVHLGKSFSYLFRLGGCLLISGRFLETFILLSEVSGGPGPTARLTQEGLDWGQAAAEPETYGNSFIVSKVTVDTLVLFLREEAELGHDGPPAWVIQQVLGGGRVEQNRQLFAR